MTTLSAASPPLLARRRLLVPASLLTVYLVWGSTYLAMRVALAWLPPALMCGVRFTVAGALLYGFLRARGVARPSVQGWAASAVVGTLLLVGGNGLVALAERSIDSGTAATVVATMPLWAAALGGVFGERPTGRELVGLAFGFAGILVLSGGGLALGGLDALAIVAAPVAWALGSLVARRLPVPAGAMGTATQMITGGLVLLDLAALRGERLPDAWSVGGLAALGYLIVFGSLLAFSAYGFLLVHTRPLVATSYAYVNPIVALLLGAALAGESLSWEKLAACLLTLTGVVLVTLRARRASVAPSSPRSAGSVRERAAL